MTDEQTETIESALTRAMAEVDKAKPEPQGKAPRIVDQHLAYLERIVDKLNSNAAALDAEIAELTSRVRQTRASIEAFGLAIERLRP